jgi:hypothetical protein
MKISRYNREMITTRCSLVNRIIITLQGDVRRIYSPAIMVEVPAGQPGQVIIIDPVVLPGAVAVEQEVPAVAIGATAEAVPAAEAGAAVAADHPAVAVAVEAMFAADNKSINYIQS